MHKSENLIEYMNNLPELQGLDIYLIDQIMKGAFAADAVILDAGCGGGRNMRWFAKNNYSIFGCDLDIERLEAAIEHTKKSPNFFVQTAVEKMPYANEMFDYVISCAVLHFATDKDHFFEMVAEMSRVLKKGGQLFIRMNSAFGLPANYQDLGNGRFLLKDGSKRFLLSKSLLSEILQMGFEQIEPVKTTLVGELRAMTTLVLIKKAINC